MSQGTPVYSTVHENLEVFLALLLDGKIPQVREIPLEFSSLSQVSEGTTTLSQISFFSLTVIEASGEQCEDT